MDRPQRSVPQPARALQVLDPDDGRLHPTCVPLAPQLEPRFRSGGVLTVVIVGATGVLTLATLLIPGGVVLLAD